MTNNREGFRPYSEDHEKPFKSVLWKRQGRNWSYSLVKVPRIEPIAITYEKPRMDLDFNLRPSEDSSDRNWVLEGRIGPDIVQKLGMPVATRYTRREHATMTEKEIDILRTWQHSRGSVDAVDCELLNVSLSLSPGETAYLLRKLWNPEGYTTQNPFILEQPGRSFRVLPEKQTTKHGSKSVSITVVQFTP